MLGGKEPLQMCVCVCVCMCVCVCVCVCVHECMCVCVGVGRTGKWKTREGGSEGGSEGGEEGGEKGKRRKICNLAIQHRSIQAGSRINQMYIAAWCGMKCNTNSSPVVGTQRGPLCPPSFPPPLPPPRQ